MPGSATLKDAFNAVASPKFFAERAFLRYTHEHDTEFEVIRFEGLDEDGKPFSTESKHPAKNDSLAAAQDAARKLLEAPPTSPETVPQ